MKWFLDVLRGMVIGLANVIPGVSGGTMMVSMGIYDKLIWSINNLFKKFRECFKILLPYLIGMVLAIAAGSVGLKEAFGKIPLQTSALFIGLILGSIPIILSQMKGIKVDVICVLLFILFAEVVIVPKVIANRGTAVNQVADLDIGHLLIYFVLGVIAAASMVIPGVSGSMMLMIFGYYKPIVTDVIADELIGGVLHGDFSHFGHAVGVLLPFALGIVVGIFGVAKLIAFLLKKWKGYTYCAILGMVAASPAVILMDKGTWQVLVSRKPDVYEPLVITPVIIITAVLALAAGIIIALKLGKDPEPVKE